MKQQYLQCKQNNNACNVNETTTVCNVNVCIEFLHRTTKAPIMPHFTGICYFRHGKFISHFEMLKTYKQGRSNYVTRRGICMSNQIRYNQHWNLNAGQHFISLNQLLWATHQCKQFSSGSLKSFQCQTSSNWDQTSIFLKNCTFKPRLSQNLWGCRDFFYLGASVISPHDI